MLIDWIYAHLVKDMDRKQKADFDASLYYASTTQDNNAGRERQLERERKARAESV